MCHVLPDPWSLISNNAARFSIISRLHLEVSLRMETCRTYGRCLGTFENETAVATLPDHIFLFLEHFAVFNVGKQSTISLLVSLLSHSDVAIHDSDGRESFLIGNISKLRIIKRPLFMLACSSCLQVLGCCTNKLAVISTIPPSNHLNIRFACSFS